MHILQLSDQEARTIANALQSHIDDELEMVERLVNSGTNEIETIISSAAGLRAAQDILKRLPSIKPSV